MGAVLYFLCQMKTGLVCAAVFTGKFSVLAKNLYFSKQQQSHNTCLTSLQKVWLLFLKKLQRTQL